ncbi:MAG: hypothetical protein ABJB39_05235 [Chloroflexota bacterium]
MWRRASALALLLAACGPAPVTVERTATPTIVVVPTELPNGRIEIALRPRYVLGAGTRVDVTIITTRGTISGPTEARVMASGINEGGSPAEVLVRRLDAPATTVTAGKRATTTLTWNGEDQFGTRVPADAYVLLLEFESTDGNDTRTVRATATLQMND